MSETTDCVTSREEIERLRAKLKEANNQLDRIADNMPECWPTDATPLEFVESILAEYTETPGHAVHCDCFG